MMLASFLPSLNLPMTSTASGDGNFEARLTPARATLVMVVMALMVVLEDGLSRL